MKRLSVFIVALCCALPFRADGIVKPVVQNASPEACALLNYLYEIKGKVV